jgi:hypothetical protein
VATGYIILPAAAAVLPDGSTTNLAARMQRVKGTGSAPVPHWLELAYPDASTTGAVWTAELPPDSNATPAPAIKLFWKGNTTSAQAVRWSVQVAAWSASATTALPAHNYSTANLATASTGTTTARQLNTTSITLTNADSIAAGQIFSLLIQRLGADGADTMTVDAELMFVELSYVI